MDGTSSIACTILYGKCAEITKFDRDITRKVFSINVDGSRYRRLGVGVGVRPKDPTTGAAGGCGGAESKVFP